VRLSSAEKYLQHYADLRDFVAPAINYAHVVIVPARNENENIDALLGSVRRASPKALTVVVVNASDQCDEGVLENNAQLFLRLQNIPNVLPLDATSKGLRIPKKGGVGIARKIGADVALSLMESGHILEPILYFTDADALVPEDYFSRIRGGLHQRAAAYLFPLTHSRGFSQAQENALSAYEISFRLYALGLLRAGSPYAFLTVGSTIAVSKDAYLKVRGVPKKAAGEDFHLLNKLAKVGPIVQLGGAPLMASGRFSKRVPFGTGQAVLKTPAHLIEEAKIDWPSYDPIAYDILKEGLEGLKQAIEQGSLVDIDFKRAFAFFERLGTLKAIAPLLKRPPKNRALAVHSAFDALRTLQFIHAVRDDLAPSISARQAAYRAQYSASAEAPYDEVLEKMRAKSALLQGAIGPTILK